VTASFENRRRGTTRRRAPRTVGRNPERREADRRQFPPPEDPSALTTAAVQLQEAIDNYKIERGLARITVPELIGLLEQLGYSAGVTTRS
jgi:hypothetical protein